MTAIVKRILSLILSCCCIFSVSACGDNNSNNNGNTSSVHHTSCTHNFIDTTTKQATCKETGVKTYTCTLCSDSYTEDIPINYNHSGEFQCSICNKIFYNILIDHISKNSAPIRFTDSVKAIGLSFMYFDSGTPYIIEIVKAPDALYFIVYAEIACFISFETSTFKFKLGGEILSLNVSQQKEFDPALVTPSWNKFNLSDKYISAHVFAQRIKLLLDATNYYLIDQSLGFSMQNFGFVNYPMTGE